MKIDNIEISGVGGIASLFLVFNDRMNIICGPNGIGKTTILESVAHLFLNGHTQILRRNVNSKNGRIAAQIENQGTKENCVITFDNFNPRTSDYITGLPAYFKKIISFKTHRNIVYHSIDAVSKDPERNNFNDIVIGIKTEDIKNWFVNRFLYSAHEGSLSSEQIENFEFAKRCFSLLNAEFSFSRVDAASNDIFINTPNGEIYYEYLSSGFKSVLAILFGIIKEVEFRLTDVRIFAQNFDGIILIDEIELHLHPEWQERIASILLAAFPNVQFFVTTHSPHVIQTAEHNQIIALERTGNDIIQRQLPVSDFGFKGWTIEEILIDIMGMPNIRTETFNSLIHQFETSIMNEDYTGGHAAYSQINLLLHPQNELRKLLKFQLAAIKED